MITLVGKILVYLIFVVSLFLAVMAIGVSSSYVPWAGSSTPGESAGIHSIKITEIKDKQAEFIRQRVRWTEEKQALALQEARRTSNQEWYKDQISALRTGKDTKGQEVKDEVKSLTYQPDGRLKLDANERPILGASPDARFKNRKALDDDLTKVDNELKEVIQQINDLIEDQKKFTLELVGDPGKKKGLLSLLADAQRDQRNALLELQATEQEATSEKVTVEELRRRQRQLKLRVKELREMGVAQGGAKN